MDDVLLVRRGGWHQRLARREPTQPATLTVASVRLARSQTQKTKWLAIRAHGPGRELMRATLRRVAQLAEPLNRLTIEVQVGGVVQAQHHWQPGHSLHRAPAARVEAPTQVGVFVA